MKRVNVDDILDFKESLSVLLISGLFIILAARTEFSQFNDLGVQALVVFLAIQFVARPAKVLVSTWGSTLTWQERALLSWIAPRGIVAAAVTALFALRLQQQGHDQAALLVPLIFMVIIGTVVLQSATARPIARWLGVAEPEAKGFLLIGANPFARALAKALNEKGYRTLLADSNWDNIRAALMDGLKTYYGNPVSEHADRHIDLVGIGQLLALSPRSELNALATMRYRAEFGPGHLFLLNPSAEDDSTEKRKFSTPKGTMALFDEKTSYKDLSDLFENGAEIRTTNITDKFEMSDYNKKYYGRSIPLFAFNPKGKIVPFVAGETLGPGAGWSVMALIQKDETDDKANHADAIEKGITD